MKANQRIRHGLIGLGLLGFLFLAPPRSFAQGSQSANLRESDKDFQNKTDKKTVEFDVSKAAKRVRLSVLIRLPQGLMRFRLLDPAGEERLQGEVNVGDGTFDTREVPAVPGLWKLTLERRNASGSYEAHWRVQ